MLLPVIEYEGDIFERSVQLNIETDKPIDEQVCIKVIERKDPDKASAYANNFGYADSESECGNDDTSEKKRKKQKSKAFNYILETSKVPGLYWPWCMYSLQ